jgi:GNAT superfamily N-acetyltransferase
MSAEGIIIKEELFSDCVEEMKPLFDLHWEEIAIHKDKIKLNPDYEKYIEMEKGGFVVTYTVRKEGVIVGYAIFFVAEHLHYKDHVYANNDIVFIAPELRRSGLAVDLFKFSEKELKEKHGASVIMVSMKVAAPFDDLLTYLDYGLIERNFSKYVGE